MVSDGSSAKEGSGGEGGYGASEEASDLRPHGFGPLLVEYRACFVISCAISARGGSGLRVDMAKVRRPRIQGLMALDLYSLIFGFICDFRW